MCCLSHTSAGKASEKSLAERAGYTLPPGSCLYQEKGFQGFCLQDVTIVQPTDPAAEILRLRRHVIPLWVPLHGSLNFRFLCPEQ
jgi:hypothetical protein